MEKFISKKTSEYRSLEKVRDIEKTVFGTAAVEIQLRSLGLNYGEARSAAQDLKLGSKDVSEFQVGNQVIHAKLEAHPISSDKAQILKVGIYE